MAPEREAHPQASEPSRGRALRALGVVLCGGASQRMGRDKARIEVAGEPLFARTARVLGALAEEVVLASGPAPRFPGVGWREVSDSPTTARLVRDRPTEPSGGPLAGIVAALTEAESSGHDVVVIAACDHPDLAPALFEPLVASIADGRADVALWQRGGFDEPLCAALSVRCAAPFRAAFEAGLRRPTEAYARVRVEAREAPRELAPYLVNVNTPAELDALRAGEVA